MNIIMIIHLLLLYRFIYSIKLFKILILLYILTYFNFNLKISKVMLNILIINI